MTDKLFQKLLPGDEEKRETFAAGFLEQAAEHPGFAEDVPQTNEGIFKENGRQNPKIHQYDDFSCSVMRTTQANTPDARLDCIRQNSVYQKWRK